MYFVKKYLLIMINFLQVLYKSTDLSAQIVKQLQLELNK